MLGVGFGAFGGLVLYEFLHRIVDAGQGGSWKGRAWFMLGGAAFGAVTFALNPCGFDPSNVSHRAAGRALPCAD